MVTGVKELLTIQGYCEAKWDDMNFIGSRAESQCVLYTLTWYKDENIFIRTYVWSPHGYIDATLFAKLIRVAQGLLCTRPSIVVLKEECEIYSWPLLRQQFAENIAKIRDYCDAELWLGL